MKTLAQFKQEEGVQTIELMQGKGRAFAKVNDKDLIVGTNTDMKQPLFVIHNEERGFYVICNAGAKVVGSI